MLNLSNTLSALRAPLAFLFLFKDPYIRILAIFLAMLTDIFDGYFARLQRRTSRFGAILDPLMDKFFVFFVLVVLFLEHKFVYWQGLCLLSRDFSLILFGCYLTITKGWKKQQFRSIFWGKVSTACQFIVLILITLNYTLPNYVFYGFILLGLLALRELSNAYQKLRIEN
ncbi:MAG: CDP-diacylglycerol--glycerol-3-phosphate 3-phosphatidyltransferase [Chlamydiae bacterium]|nr:CDP-diacylglycerol--glycerol-3-phosphate 3-phosphatidyltransferase [Chlamydiota bacterium]